LLLLKLMYRNDDSSSSGDEIIEEYKRLLATRVNKKEKIKRGLAPHHLAEVKLF